jgi:acyl-CoA synthetase (AMP-forming)/AMP-acid ligase II
VVAFVVPDDSASPPSVTDLDRTCLAHIARFKRPRDYRFVDTLPTNNYGKVVKRELRDRLRAETEEGPSCVSNFAGGSGGSEASRSTAALSVAIQESR